jgi:hypothetical protein
VRRFLVNMTLFEIPAVVLILCFIGSAVIRAFASSRADNIDIFIRRSRADDPRRN